MNMIASSVLRELRDPCFERRVRYGKDTFTLVDLNVDRCFMITADNSSVSKGQRSLPKEVNMRVTEAINSALRRYPEFSHLEARDVSVSVRDHTFTRGLGELYDCAWFGPLGVGLFCAGGIVGGFEEACHKWRRFWHPEVTCRLDLHNPYPEGRSNTQTTSSMGGLAF